MNNIPGLNEYKHCAFITKGGESRFVAGERVTLKTNMLNEMEQYQKDTHKEIIFILPFCSAQREGVGVAHGNEDILAFQVDNELTFSREHLLMQLPNEEITHSNIQTDLTDNEYGKQVEDMQVDIKNGQLCQGVLSREFMTNLSHPSDSLYLSLYKKLLGIPGGYMTYMMQFGNQIFAGASPEVHVSVQDGIVHKAPLAGTIPKGDPQKLYENIVSFLKNKKETEELSMVTDEELKMLIKICSSGEISGPFLKEIGHVIHTEHMFHGQLAPEYTAMDALRSTLFSPTIVGGPIEAAFSQIKKYETQSRKYYGTAFGTYSGDTLDTAIPIRSSHIEKDTGELSVRAGAGIVSGSTAQAEADETRKKAMGFLSILTSDSGIYSQQLPQLAKHEQNKIDKILSNRGGHLSDFYSKNQESTSLEVAELKGKSISIIQNGDDFTEMISHMLESMGMKVNIIKNKGTAIQIPENDMVLLGPGYGDINDEKDTKMQALLSLTNQLQCRETPLAGICLGHQAISKNQGLDIKLQDDISQGTQGKITMDEQEYTVGFYNSYSPIGDTSNLEETVLDESGRLLYQKNKKTVSCQFHPESIMSTQGFDILKKMLVSIV